MAALWSVVSGDMAQVLPGQIFGELSVLSDTGSFFEARVSSDTALIFRLPRDKCAR
jgi:CRP-like cAMP-binding protein